MNDIKMIDQLDKQTQDAVQNAMKGMLISLVKRSGGKVSLPCDEVDNVGGDVLIMQIDPISKTFILSITKKN